MSAYKDLEKSLTEAIEMEKGNIPLEEKENMPAPTFVAAEKENEMIDELSQIRRVQHISQKELAEMTGNMQQAISRLEQKMHSPSLKQVLDITYALGYELKLVKSNKESDAIEIMRAASRIAKENGLSDMTLDEINEEIAKARK